MAYNVLMCRKESTHSLARGLRSNTGKNSLRMDKARHGL